MRRIELIEPKKEFQEKIESYREEFQINQENMDGTSGLQNIASIDEWLNELKNNSKEETVREGLVTSSTYLAVRISDGQVVGMIDIRHKLNEYLAAFGGHIGYSVRKSERRKGYATEMLDLALEKCKELNINKVLITCDKENIASSKTIIAKNGVLENAVPHYGGITERYWITL